MIEIQWLSHAAFKIKTNNKIIYIDPRYMKKNKEYIREYFEHPEKADILLFTHHHADHCYPSSFAKMQKNNTLKIGPIKCKECIGKDSTFIQAGETLELNDIMITVVEAYNIKRKRKGGGLYHPKGLGVGYILQ
ncbi:MAG: hypothetical protein BAJALOKI1v1_190019 [Promethearchaeota archaeon]|nr:MAG: hypothetical protein BAJALOKI1v1_190019 [Candidatus Lokiarchaeota archaeon]